MTRKEITVLRVTVTRGTVTICRFREGKLPAESNAFSVPSDDHLVDLIRVLEPVDERFVVLEQGSDVELA